MKPDIPSVLVAGDIVLDRHTYEGASAYCWINHRAASHFVEEAGGAAITQRLIEAGFKADLKQARETLLPKQSP